MRNQGIQTSSTQLQAIMTVDSFTNTHDTTFLDDELIASSTYLTSQHLEGTPHALVISLPTFSQATYGLTLLASRQLRWSTTLPHPLLNPRQPPGAPHQPNPDDHQSERGPLAPSQRHIHYPQHRLPRHHRNRGFQTLSGGGHTHTLPTHLSGRTHATEQHGHKCRATLPTSSSPPTCPRLGSASW
jgi:hypothetical protein